MGIHLMIENEICNLKVSITRKTKIQDPFGSETLMRAVAVAIKHLARDARQADNVILLSEQNIALI